MRFGDYIREKRRALDWTQPEAARRIGIEQSYLSKIEAGKAYPSEEIFSSLTTVYALNVADMSGTLFAGELDRLREISEVRTSILVNQRETQADIRKFLYAGIVSLMIGGACLGINLLGKPVVIDTFQYQSQGVLLEGESHNAYDIIGQDFLRGDPERETKLKRQQEMLKRLDPKFKYLKNFKGPVYREEVEGGTRFWTLLNSREEVIQSPFRWFIIPAVMFTFGAFGCFFASYRHRSA